VLESDLSTWEIAPLAVTFCPHTRDRLAKKPVFSQKTGFLARQNRIFLQKLV